MGIKVIGAGLGRTGTTSLKIALESILGGPCYHMSTLFEHPEHISAWFQINSGVFTSWNDMFDGYMSITDWPAAPFYQDFMDAFPDAKVLLSYRDPEKWLTSCRATIFPKIASADGEWGEMIRSIIHNTFTDDLENDEKCLATYKAHNDQVRKTVPANKLIEWMPENGWTPICEGLGVTVPEQPFPHVNTTEDFLTRSKSS